MSNDKIRVTVDGEPALAEPLSDEEIVRLEGVLRQVRNHGMTPSPTMFRLLATVRACEAERDAALRDLADEKDRHIESLRIANDAVAKLTIERDAAMAKRHDRSSPIF